MPATSLDTVGKIHVLGTAWMPMCDMGMTITVTRYDAEHMQNPETLLIDRETVLERLYIMAGDFQAITDFRAEIGSVVIDWQDENNEWKWNDCVFGPEF